MQYDSIIIGNGPAGISASIYLKRAGRNPLIISKNDSALLKAKEIENYYGFPDSISGATLYQNGITQAKNMGIQMIEEEVVSIEYDTTYHVITTKSTYDTKGLILATGLTRKTLSLPGLKEYEGKGVSYCAVCDGFFYRNKSIAVLGSKEYARHEIEFLHHFVKDITIVTNGVPLEFTLQENEKYIEKKIKEIKGDDSKITSIIFEDDTKIEIEGLFIAVGTAGSTDFAKKLGIAMDKNQIIVNDKMQTNLPGLYACGDATGGLLQVAKAIYEGAKAGTELNSYLKQN